MGLFLLVVGCGRERRHHICFGSALLLLLLLQQLIFCWGWEACNWISCWIYLFQYFFIWQIKLTHCGLPRLHADLRDPRGPPRSATNNFGLRQSAWKSPLRIQINFLFLLARLVPRCLLRQHGWPHTFTNKTASSHYLPPPILAWLFRGISCFSWWACNNLLLNHRIGPRHILLLLQGLSRLRVQVISLLSLVITSINLLNFNLLPRWEARPNRRTVYSLAPRQLLRLARLHHDPLFGTVVIAHHGRLRGLHEAHGRIRAITQV